MAAIDIAAELRKVPLFAELDDSDLQAIRQGTSVRRVSRGELLFQKGDPALGFYFLVDGQLKLALLGPEGHEMVIELIQPGMSFGEAVVFIDRPFPAYAEALKASRVLFISREPLLKAVRSQPEFAMRLLAGLSVRLHRLVREIEELTTRNALQRVIGYLLGEWGATGTTAVRLPTSKSVTAARLNLTPETFSRMLHTLQERELIAVDGRTITLVDPAGLAAAEPQG